MDDELKKTTSHLWMLALLRYTTEIGLGRENIFFHKGSWVSHVFSYGAVEIREISGIVPVKNVFEILDGQEHWLSIRLIPKMLIKIRRSDSFGYLWHRTLQRNVFAVASTK